MAVWGGLRHLLEGSTKVRVGDRVVAKERFIGTLRGIDQRGSCEVLVDGNLIGFWKNEVRTLEVRKKEPEPKTPAPSPEPNAMTDGMTDYERLAISKLQSVGTEAANKQIERIKTLAQARLNN